MNELEQGVGASYLIWKTIIGETVKFLSPLDKAVTQAYSVDYSHVTYYVVLGSVLRVENM